MSPYLIIGLAAGVLGIAIGAGGMHTTVDAAQLAHERTVLALEQADHARDLGKASAAAAQAASDALVKQTAMQQATDAAQAALTKAQGETNAVDQKYRAAVAAGTQRMRVAVRNCRADDPASGSAVRSDPQSAGGNADAAASADLDPAVAERVFAVTADDQREIDKLAQLQAWACTVKPDTPDCEKK